MPFRYFTLIICLLSTVCFLLSDALHCLGHEQCGDHAACITMSVEQTPKCMCLVGYYGNGAICTELGEEQPTSVRLGGGRKQIDTELLRRTLCKSATNDIGADNKLETSNNVNTDSPVFKLAEFGKRPEVVKAAVNAQSKISRVRTLAIDSKPRLVQPESLCPKLECNFNDGPCLYKNMLNSFWFVRDTAFFDKPTGEKSENLVATVKGDEAQEHFLMSDTAFLPERVNMTFDYFESDHFAHLKVCQDNTSSCAWTSDGTGGWRSGRIELPPGNHKVIFSVKELSHARSVAIDNLKLENVFGSPASCS